MHNSQLLRRLAQAAFWAALVFIFVEAVIPPKNFIPLFPWNKAERFAAFFALTGWAAAAFPRRSLIVIAIILSAFGGLIELVQALPIVNRDCDFWDWVADTVVVGAAIASMALVWWNAQFSRAYGNP